MEEQPVCLLVQDFEDLVLSRGAELLNKTAIWHIPDPRGLEPGNGQTDLSKNIKSITFGDILITTHKLTARMLEAFDHLPNQRNFGLGEVGSECNIQEQTVIIIFMPPGIDRILVQIACMKLRLAYLPLDWQLSIGRIVQIVEEVRPISLLMSQTYYDLIFSARSSSSNSESSLKRTHCSYPDQSPGSTSSDTLNALKMVLDKFSPIIFEDLMRNESTLTNEIQLSAVEQPSPQSMAEVRLFPNVINPVIVILFTSGSTMSGPKIVRLRNSQLRNRLRWQWEINRWPYVNHVSLASTACVFVDAFTELFSSLFATIPVVVPGGTECASELSVSDFRTLYKLIIMFKITHLTTVPMQLSTWLRQLDFMKRTNELEGRTFYLDTVVVSGDLLLPQLATKYFRLCSSKNTRLLNLYGTTEVAGDVTAAIFTSEQEVHIATKCLDCHKNEGCMYDNASFLTVGKPISNTSVYIVRRLTNNGTEVNQNMQMSFNGDRKDSNHSSIIGVPTRPLDWNSLGYELCDKGVVGEVAITGLPVNGTKTDQMRKNNGRPSEYVKPGTINFTGDVGFICPNDDQLYICGRSDELVKINAVGFLANDVDRLIPQIKESFSSTESNSHDRVLRRKLMNLKESVTLPIEHPINQTKQIVCFYVGEPTGSTEEVKVKQMGEFENKLEERIDYSSPLLIINPSASNWDGRIPKPSELSSIISQYLPVYIRPVFLRINKIPTIPASGKVDKQRLRSLYHNTFSKCTVDRDSKANGKYVSLMPNKLAEKPEFETVTRESLGFPSDNRQPNTHYREEARRVIASILGHHTNGSNGSPLLPHDQDDFFLLGGNSLMAVLALESLRQFGFQVNLETFYHNSNIGFILDSMIPPKTKRILPPGDWNYNGDPMGRHRIGLLTWPNNREAHQNKLHPCKLNYLPYYQSVGLEKSGTVEIEEWNNSKSMYGLKDMKCLLINAFWDKDPITHALGLSRADLELATETYMNPKFGGIILIATYHPTGAEVEIEENHGELIGVLLSIPSGRMPHLPPTAALVLLQNYFDFCCPIAEQPDDTKLSVIMIGVGGNKRDVEETYPNAFKRAKWSRLALETLSRLEYRLLQVARAKRYDVVETLNTCETTKNVCSDLGYRLIKSTRMDAFKSSIQFPQNISHDPTHYSYYMQIQLNEQ